MFCSNCGTKNISVATFCSDCGKEIGHTSHKHVDKNLEKIYKDTGNSSIALSIFGIVASFLFSLIDYSLEETIVGLIIVGPFFAPFYYYGKKLRDTGMENIHYALKVAKGMIFYTIFFIIAGTALGGVGWLWLVLLYYFFKSYRETKKVLTKSRY